MTTATALSGWPSAAERAELAALSASFRPSTVCTPVGAAYAADDTGGRTMTAATDWTEHTAGVRPEKIADDRRPAGDTNSTRRRWTVTTAPTVDLLADNPTRVVALGTLAELTAAITAGTVVALGVAVIVGAPDLGEMGTVAVWTLEELGALP